MRIEELNLINPNNEIIGSAKLVEEYVKKNCVTKSRKCKTYNDVGREVYSREIKTGGRSKCNASKKEKWHVYDESGRCIKHIVKFYSRRYPEPTPIDHPSNKIVDKYKTIEYIYDGDKLVLMVETVYSNGDVEFTETTQYVRDRTAEGNLIVHKYVTECDYYIEEEITKKVNKYYTYVIYAKDNDKEIIYRNKIRFTQKNEVLNSDWYNKGMY